MSYESRNRYMPPRSAAAPGSALTGLLALLARLEFHPDEPNRPSPTRGVLRHPDGDLGRLVLPLAEVDPGEQLGQRGLPPRRLVLLFRLGRVRRRSTRDQFPFKHDLAPVGGHLRRLELER